jgi:cyclic lactone autoinducer peptide
MLKFLKRNALTTISTVAAFVAMANILSSRSIVYLYKPEVPESLKK